METNKHYTWPVSKKLVGRITEIIAPKVSEIFDTVFVEPQKKDKIYENLLTIPPHVWASLVQLESLNTKFPGFLELLFSSIQRLWPQLDIASLKELCSFFISVFLWEKNLSELEICIGMGGTDFAPSVRIPIVIMPAIFFLEEVLQLQKKYGLTGTPRVTVFKAQYIAQSVNWYDPDKSWTATNITFQLLQRYVQEFHPNLLSYFEFTADSWYDEVKEDITWVMPAFKEAATISWQIDSLLSMGRKHGGKNGESNAVYYASAHPIYNGFLDTGKSLNWHIRSQKKWININFWGSAERTFNRTMRQLGANRKLNFNPTVFVVCDKLKVPSYYPARKWDIKADNYEAFGAANIESFDPLVSSDISTILSDARLTLEKYLEFIRK